MILSEDKNSSEDGNTALVVSLGRPATSVTCEMLIKQITSDTLPHSVVKIVVERLFLEIGKEILDARTVKIRNFGSFVVRKTKIAKPHPCGGTDNTGKPKLKIKFIPSGKSFS